jgi:hypothetical protein
LFFCETLSHSRGTQNEFHAFHPLTIAAMIPSTILFVAFNAFPKVCQLSIADCDLCPGFAPWWGKRVVQRLRFRRIFRVGSGLCCLTNVEINLNISEQLSVPHGFNEMSSQEYLRPDDGSTFGVQSMHRCESAEICAMAIGNVPNLRHP